MIIGVCSVCSKTTQIRAGMCISHYAANWRKEMRKVPCKVDGCKNGVKCRMMCDTHFRKHRLEVLALQAENSAEQEEKRLEAIEKIRTQERERIIELLETSIVNGDGYFNIDEAVALIERENK